MSDSDYYASLLAPQAPAAGSDSNPLWAGIKSGSLGMAGSIAGAVGAGAQLVGFGNDNYFANAAKGLNAAAEAQGRPDIEAKGWTGDGISGFAKMAAYRLGQFVPQAVGLGATSAALAPLLPEAVGAGVLGRLGMAAPEFLGGAGGEAGAARAAAILGDDGAAKYTADQIAKAQSDVGAGFAKGLVAGAAPLAATSVGDIYNDANSKDGGATYGDAAKAAALGIPVGVVQAIGPHGASGIVNSGLAHAGAFAIGQGIQEAAISSNRDMTAGERAQAILQAAAGGAVFGGLMGGVQGAARIAGERAGFLDPHADTNALNTALDAQLNPQPASVPNDPQPPGSGSSDVPAQPVPNQTSTSSVPPQNEAPSSAPDLAALTAGMADSRSRQASPDLKDMVAKVRQPLPIQAPEAVLSPEQEAALKDQPQSQMSALQNLRALYESQGDKAGVDRIDVFTAKHSPEDINDMRNAVGAANPEEVDNTPESTLAKQEDAAARERDAQKVKQYLSASAMPSTDDAARQSMFRTLGDVDDAIKPGTKMRDFIDNSKSTSPIDLYNEMKQETDDKTSLSKTPAFRKMAAQLGFGKTDDGYGPIDLAAARETAMQLPSPEERNMALDRLNDMEAIRDAAAQQRERVPTTVAGPVEATNDLQNQLDGNVQVAGLRMPIPDTPPREFARAPEPGPAVGTAQPVAAAPAAPVDAEPKSIAERIVNFAHSLLGGATGETGGEVPIGRIRAGLPDVSTSDFENALRQIHADDSENELTQAPKGQRAGVDGIKVEGQGRFHNLSVEARGDGGIQERGAAQADVGDQPAGGGADGAGDRSQGQAAGAQPDQGGAQVVTPPRATEAETALEAHQRFMREQDDYAAQALREMQNPETGATELPAEAVGGTDAEAAQALARSPETVPPRLDAPLMPRIVYSRDVDSMESENAAHTALRDELATGDLDAAGRFNRVASQLNDMRSESMPASAVFSLIKNGVSNDDIMNIARSDGTDYFDNIANAIQKSGKSLDQYFEDYDHAKQVQSAAISNTAKTMADLKDAFGKNQFEDALGQIASKIAEHQASFDASEPIKHEAQQALTKIEEAHGGDDKLLTFNGTREANPEMSELTMRTLSSVLPLKARNALRGAFDNLARDPDVQPAEVFALAKLGLDKDQITRASRVTEAADPSVVNEYMSHLQVLHGFTSDELQQAFQQGSRLAETTGETLGQRVQRLMMSGLKPSDVGLPDDVEIPHNSENKLKFETPNLSSETFYSAPKPTDRQLSAVKDVDWSTYKPDRYLQFPQYRGTNPLSRVAETLRGMGFNPDVRMFAGTIHDPAQHGLRELDPISKPAERALFRGDTHHVSNAYTEAGTYRRDGTAPQSRMPQIVRASKAAEIDWSAWNHSSSSPAYYNGEPMRALIEWARKQNYDVLAVKGISDNVIPMDATKVGRNGSKAGIGLLSEENVEFGGQHTQYLVLKPELLRQQNAAFDPARLNENNLLAKVSNDPSVTPVPPDRATIQSWLDATMDKAHLRPEVRQNIHLLDSNADLPEVAKEAGRQSGVDFKTMDVPGVQHDGQVYIFADKISGPAELQGLIAHEVTHAATDIMTRRDTDSYTAMLSSFFDRAGGYDSVMKLADRFGVREELEAYPFVRPDMNAFDKARTMDELFSLTAEAGGKGLSSNPQFNQTLVGRVKAGIVALMRKLGMNDFADRFAGYGVADVQKWIRDGQAILQDRQPPNTLDLSSLPGIRRDMIGLNRSPLMPKIRSIRDQNSAVETGLRAAGALFQQGRKLARSDVAIKLADKLYDIWQANDFERAFGKKIPSIVSYNHWNKLGAQVTAALRQTIAEPVRIATRLATNDPRLFERIADVLQTASGNRLVPGLDWEKHTWLRDAPNRDELRTALDRINVEFNRWGQPLKSKMSGLFRRTDGNLEPGALLDLYSKMQAGDQFLRNMAHISTLHTAVRGMLDTVPGFERHAAQDYVDQRDLHGNVVGARDYSRAELNKLLDAADAHLQSADMESAPSKILAGEVAKIRDELQDTDRGVPYTHFGRFGDQFASGRLIASEGGATAHPEGVKAFMDWFADHGMSDVTFNSTNTNRDFMVRMSNEQSRIDFAKAIKNGELAKWMDPEVEPKDGVIGSDKTAQPDAIPLLMQMEDRMARSGVPLDLQQKNRAMMQGIMFDLMPQDSSRKLNAQRMNVQGQSASLLRNMDYQHGVMLNSIGHGAVLVDRARADAGLTKQRRDMATSSHPLHDQVGPLSRAIDAFRARNDAQTSRVQGGFVSAMRNAAHGYSLAASPMYIAMQAMQPYMLTLPVLGRHYAYPKVVSALTGSLRDVAPLMKAMVSVHKDILAGKGDTLSTGVTNEALRRYVAGAGSDAERVRRGNIADYLKQIDSRGMLESGTMSYDNLAANDRWQALGVAKKAYQVATSTATYAELGGRLIAGLAAKTLHDADPTKARGYENDVHAFGAHVISDSMMEWGAQARSRLASAGGPLGPAAPLMMQFHGFGTQLYRLIMDSAGDAISGDTPEERTEARRFLAGHLVASMTLAGSLGLPFAGWAAAAATKGSTLLPGSGGESYDVEAHYRDFLASIFGQKVGEVLAHGLPRFINTDLSDLGDKDLLPMQSFLEDRRKLEDAIPDYLAKSWGSSVGIAANGLIALRDLGEGRVLTGMSRFMPTAMRNFVKSYQIAEHGFQNSQGENMPIDANAVDVLKQALGFKSAEVLEDEEKSNSVMGARDDRTYHAGVIKQQLARAIESGDETGQQRWMNEMSRYDMDPSHAGVPIGPSFKQYLEARQRAVQYSRATGLPLNAMLKDITTNAMVGGY